MKLSRRNFLFGSVSSIVLLKASSAKARLLHGASGSGRVTINVPPGYLNLVKGFGFQPDPANQDSNGYPVTTPTSTMVANINMPSNYWGDFVWKWAGEGSMDIVAGPPTIVSQSTQGSGSFQVGDSAGGNQALTSVTAPRIQFKFGINIQGLSDSGVSNGAGGTMIRVATKTGFAANIQAGNAVNVSGVVSGQTNANGTWTMAAVGGNTSAFDLVGSTWSSANGTSGVGGVAAMQYTNSSIRIVNTGTFSGFSNLVWCKSGDETAITNGQMTDTVLLNQLQYLCNPNSLAAPNVWLRFMDFSGAQQNIESDYSQRILPSQISYNAQYFRNSYWVGTISNSSDALTCSDPSISTWNGSSYIDNAIVQGNVNIANSTGFPTLAVGGHPAKPIFAYLNETPIHYSVAAPAGAAGQVLHFKFSAGGAAWLNSGSDYSLTYTTTTTGPNGNDTTSATALAFNIATVFENDTVLKAAGLQYGNPGPVTIYPRTAQAGRLSLTQTNTDPTLITIQQIDPSAIATGNSTFVYNYLLDGWIYRAGGTVMAGPLEIAAEICNFVKAHCWWNWGTVKGGLVTSVTNFFATNLNSGLKFGTEPGNEVWNTGAAPFGLWSALGAALGFSEQSFIYNYSYAALRACQYYALSSAAWTSASRAASDHFVIQPSATFDVTINGNFDTAQLKGAYLNRTGGTVNGVANNPIYGTYGGLNGSGAISVDYNVSPNRPVDITGATGCAPYWSSHWLGNGGSITSASDIVGTVTQNAPWLQAALDYMNGNTATAFASMVNQFTEVTGGGSGNNGFDFVDMGNTFGTEETMIAQYDGSRPAGMSKLFILDYECGPSWGVGSNGINGINTIGLAGINSSNGDVQAIASRMSALGWNVSAYGSSSTDYTGVAIKAVTMFQGWKYDIDHTGAAANTGSYKNMIKKNYYAARNVHNRNREAHAAQFGYGTGAQWGLMFPDYNTLEKYTNYDAIHEFNS